MHYTFPPIWNLLTQLRVIFMALIYRSVFGRTLSIIQWIAFCIVTIAVILLQFNEFTGNPSLSDQRTPVSLIVRTLGVNTSVNAALAWTLMHVYHCKANSGNFDCVI